MTPPRNMEIQHLHSFLKFTDDKSKRDIERLGVSDIDDLRDLEDKDVDWLINLSLLQKRRLKTIIKFLKTAVIDFDCTTTYEKIRKYVLNSDINLQLHDINLPNYDAGNQELNKWINKVDCIMRQHGMSDLLDDNEFAEAQPLANKAFYAMLCLALEDTPALSFIENVPNNNGFQAWKVLSTINSRNEETQDKVDENQPRPVINCDENTGACIVLPEKITNRLSKNVKNLLAELNRKIAMELQDKFSNGPHSESENDETAREDRASSAFYSTSKDITDVTREDPNRNSFKKTNADAQDMQNANDDHIGDENETDSANVQCSTEKNSFESDRYTLLKRNLSSADYDTSKRFQVNHNSNEKDHDVHETDSRVTFHDNQKRRGTYSIVPWGPTHQISKERYEEIPLTTKNSSITVEPDNIINDDSSADDSRLDPETNTKGRDVLPHDYDVAKASTDCGIVDDSSPEVQTETEIEISNDKGDDDDSIVEPQIDAVEPSNVQDQDIILNENDVLKYKQDHIGTIKYNELLEFYVGDAMVGTFISVAGTILRRLKSMDPPARILKKVGKGDSFEIVTEDLANISRDVAALYKKKKKAGQLMLPTGEGNYFNKKIDENSNDTERNNSRKRLRSSTEKNVSNCTSPLKNNPDSDINGDSSAGPETEAERESTNTDLQNIVLNENDVIKSKQDHPGTIKYNELLQSYVGDAVSMTYTSIAENVLHHLRSMDPPSRILKKVGKDECFEEIPEDKLKEYISRDLANLYKKLKKSRQRLLTPGGDYSS